MQKIETISSWVSQIHEGFCEDLIPKLPDNSIDLVVTSPPYNVDLGDNRYNKSPYDLYQDNKDHKKFLEELTYVFEILKPKLVEGGRVCINIGDGKNGNVPTHSDIIQFMTKDLKYLIKSTIIWNKNQTSNRAAWGTFISPFNPSFPTPFEYILIFCNETQSKNGNKDNITVNKSEFVRNSLALWSFKAEKNMKKLGHPAMFPIELPYRLIQQLSYKDDVVLDIFAGAGTTCLAAEMLERRWIGFEMSEEYVGTARKRISQYTDQTRF